ncbi:MAG: hypothetical protein AMXMBFR53_22280 [Gemmatimonadota bacterium]
MLRRPLASVALLVLALGSSACDGTDPTSPDDPSSLTPDPAFSTGDGCDLDLNPGDWCDPGIPGTGPFFDYNIFRGFVGTWHDTNLYQASGDPAPWSNGVWLGSWVTPSACANPAPGLDVDGDGFQDACEFALARAFAPYLQYAAGEPCAKGAPAWAVRSPAPGVVRIAYMMSYYLDCGSGVLLNGTRWFGGHAGDSEIIGLRVTFNGATSHWEFSQMFTSAHSGEFGPFDQSRSSGPTSVTFPVKYLAFPQVWVALRKHANYPSAGICNSSINRDYCTSDEPIRYRFNVDPARNTSYWGLPNCLTSPHFAGTECYFTPVEFRGWQDGEPGVTPYAQMLVRSGFFDS